VSGGHHGSTSLLAHASGLLLLDLKVMSVRACGLCWCRSAPSLHPPLGSIHQIGTWTTPPARLRLGR
jgi:hypothetical protein